MAARWAEMQSRVGSLELHVRTADGHADEIEPAARAFALRALTRCEELLEERAPERVILMRHLDMKLRLLEDALPNEGELEVFACGIADALEQKAREVRAPLSDDQELVVFQDESHWRAEYLASVTREEKLPWFFEALAAEGEPPGALLLPEKRSLTRSVLLRLYVRGILAETLGALGPARLRELREAAGARTFNDEPHSGLPPALPGELEEIIRRLPAQVRGEVTALCLLAIAHAPEEARRPIPHMVSRAETITSETIETAFGGLFYLLSPVLELGLGEALWRACLPEDRVLTEVSRLLLGQGAENDSAPALFGGARSNSELSAITQEQQAEVAIALLGALVSALPRRGLAQLPEPLLGLVQSPAGRLLVATARGSAFVLFAWPADAALEVEEGLRTFLAVWPQTAPAPRASPALAEIDRTGRLRSDREACLSNELLLPTVSDPHGLALVAHSAGSLGYLFAARAGSLDLHSSSGLVQRHFHVPAHVTIWEEEMVASMPMERIDLALRRAGLDSDPGWVPWLGKRARFEFVESS